MKNVFINYGKGRLVAMLIALLIAPALWAQNMLKVTGRVLDDAETPIIGASVLEKGTTNGTITDLDGNFVLQVKSNSTMVFSYIGYVNVEAKPTAKMKVVLREDTKALEEVVVIGYGTTKAKNFTGSVDRMKMEDSPVSDLNLSSATDLLRGRLSGLVMGAESGTVGQKSSILIRGKKSINSTSEEPLIILNNVIFAGELNDIDPTTIESISVLKDATSLAAYGSRAAQGVIMVTTKKGKEGKPVINFSTSHQFSTPTYKQKYLSGQDYIRYRNAKAGSTDLENTGWMSFIEKANYEKGKTTNWYDLVQQEGYTQNYNVSISGASEKMNYFVGAGHSNQKGMTVGNGYKRDNINMNVTSKITSFLEMGANFNYTSTIDDKVQAGLYHARQTPYGEAYLPDGRWRKFIDGRDNTTFNPVWDAYNGREQDNRRSNLTLGGFANVQIPWVKGLSFRMNVSYSKILTDNKSFYHESNYPTMVANDWDGVGYTNQYLQYELANGTMSNSTRTNWVIDNILSYANSFGDHFVSASLVYTRDSDEYSTQSYKGENFKEAGNTILGWYGLGNATVKNFASPTYQLHTDVGYLARVMWSYKDTYHLNASLRRDGSSVFGNDHKWGNFPAFGAAWTISKEKFMEKFKFIDMLKLKLSYGKNGAQTISPYGTLTSISNAKDGNIINNYGGSVHWGQSIATLGNSTLGWQTTTSWNGGFEADVLNRRLHFEANFYVSKTVDQIFDRKIPIMGAGIATQKATMGQVNNTGIEINASSINLKKKDFTWTTDLTFTLNRNKLKDLYGDGKDDITNSLFLNHSLGAFYGYRTDGIFQEGSTIGTPGTPIFLDKDGNQTANPTAEDKVILGYSQENFRMSLANTISYKKFQLYVMFSGIFSGGGYGMADNTFAYTTYSTGASMSAYNIDFWTPANKSNTCPSPSYSNPGTNYVVYNNYGHIRLQDVSLSYNLSSLLQKYGFKNVKISLSGRNLFYIAPSWKMSDPEARSGDSISLPKAVTLALNLTF